MKKSSKNRLLTGILVTTIMCASVNGGLYGYALETEAYLETETFMETETVLETETQTDETESLKETSVQEAFKGEAETESETEHIEENTPFVENSFRYQNGEWMHNEIMFYADGFKPWTLFDGKWINSLGKPIVGALEKGIDVSSFQKEIDWQKVADSDVSYAIIRCGYGNDEISQDDSYWKYNADECTRLGIPFGVYIYSYAMNVEEAKSEAEHVLRLVEGYDLSYPIYFDLEDEKYTGKLTNKEIADIAEVFCDTVEAAGYDVGIYANLYWFNNKLTDSRFDQWPKWIAQYNSQCDYRGEYTMWQCTSSGIVDGIEGTVDLNFTIDPSQIEEPEMSEQEKQIQAFVERLYKLVLNREPDTAGLREWKNKLANQEETGAEVARGFVFSSEFLDRKTSDEEFVEIMYQTFLGRPSDSNGKESWMECLIQGFSREYILKGFIESKEFNDICSEYGILRGTIPLNNIQDKNPEITKYLFRCYDIFLDRKPDMNGLIDWVEAFVIRKENPKEITKGFVFSNEMKKQNLSDEEFIKVLYRGLFGREADASGLNDWMKWIDEGKSREDIFEGFTGSKEFYELVKSFGL